MKNMNKTMKLGLISMLVVFFATIFTSLSFAKTNNNLYEEILKETESSVCEYGVSTSFKTKEDGQQLCHKIVRELGYATNIKNINKKDNYYSLEFSKELEEGSVESITCDGEIIITIKLVRKDNINKVEDIKSKIKTVTNALGHNTKIFQYVKASLKDDDIKSTNQIMLKILKKHGASNIKTVEISNGYSTIALTDISEPIYYGDKMIDFNCAVCKYSKCNYLIIGAPEILATY